MNLIDLLVIFLSYAGLSQIGDIIVTDKGSLRIGRITMQRKGGDGGRESAKMLQFKINPIV